MCDVQQVFIQLTANGNAELTFDRLREDVECYRNKPLLIEVDTMPVSMSGYVVGLKDVDLICTNPDLDDLLTSLTILHELAHLRLNHVPKLSNGPSTPTYDEFIRHRDPKYAFLRSHSNGFEDVTEGDAELLATLLLEYMLNGVSSMPGLTRNFYS
jgi:hypothetical protein